MMLISKCSSTDLGSHPLITTATHTTHRVDAREDIHPRLWQLTRQARGIHRALAFKAAYLPTLASG